MSDKAKFIIDNKEYELPIYKANRGPRVVDVSSFYNDTGCFTYDPGFMSTAACKSSIAYIDGPKGELVYRGYKIEDVCKKCIKFEETIHLLLEDTIPNESTAKNLSKNLAQDMILEDSVIDLIRSCKKDDHPMAILISTIGRLAAIYNNDDKIVSENKDYQYFAHKTIAKLPALVANIFRHSQSKSPSLLPSNELSYSQNFVRMMFGDDDYYEIDNDLAKAFDMIFTLHADHEQNASTSTVRLAGSTGTNMFAAIASGVCALWGAAHGGANEAVIKCLEEIGSVNNLNNYIEGVKSKKFRLMGFGHRVYKNYDPRAKVLKEQADIILKKLGHKDNELLEIAQELEKLALGDDYFISRNLYPNVDFYSGIILQAIGIPVKLFTAIFALGRTTGWVAQLIEMLNDPSQKIGRPRQLYLGK